MVVKPAVSNLTFPRPAGFYHNLHLHHWADITLLFHSPDTFLAQVLAAVSRGRSCLTCVSNESL